MTRPGHRLIAVPKNYYEQLRQMQDKLMREQQEKVPLWRCAKHVEMERERWRDDEWFNFQRRNRRGNLFDMFPIVFMICVALIFAIMAILFINGINDAIQSANIGSAGKQFMNNIQSQNDWVVDFLFVMFLISLPVVSAILAYFNNIPPFLFWASIGVIMLVIILANVMSDAYVNITNVSGMTVVTSSIPMTDYIMRHFVIYAFVACAIIMFGVFLKPKSQYGYGS